jgi:hypothetical protein
VQASPLAQLYSSKTDDELLTLAADPYSLVDEARPILADELHRRNLAQPITRPFADHIPGFWRTTSGKILGGAGAFVLNLVAAILGTAVIASPIWSWLSHARSVSAIEEREWLLSATIAALLGFFVCQRWPMRIAAWVWTLPVAWFALGFLAYQAPRSALLSSRSEHFFAPNCLNYTSRCRDFIVFTIPAVRAAAYSLGAWVSVHFRGHPIKELSPKAGGGR